MAHPNERSVHLIPAPYLGGVAMFGGLAGALYATRFTPLKVAWSGSTLLPGVIVAAAVMTAVGTLDDVREVSAPAKFAGQILAGSVLVFFGVALLYLRVPFTKEFVVLTRDVAPIATVVWVMGMTNAVNFIDGLDGLAAGLVGLASIAFFIFSFNAVRSGTLESSDVGPLIAAATAGVSLGFLPWNWNPARIFMGDGGAYLLGLLMAASTILVGGNSPEVFPGKTYFFFAPLVVPLVILGVPIFDTGFAILRRLTRGRSKGSGGQHTREALGSLLK